MANRIQWALKGEQLVTLGQVSRGDKGLTCHTCGDKIAVKDGGGERVTGKTRRNQARRKHFSHTPNSKCHGEGPAHYRLKTALCCAIYQALSIPRERRNMRGFLAYMCQDPEYAPNDPDKFAPPVKQEPNRAFESMRHGYHQYDLLHSDAGRRFSDAPILNRAECEVWLGGRRTRADIAGKDAYGNVLWIIEVCRTGDVSQKAVDYAQEKSIPLFIIDIGHLPKPTSDDPMAEIKCWDYFIVGENLARGFYPSSTRSHNVGCERKAFGMGPDDHSWQRQFTLVHRGSDVCTNEGDCPGCDEVLLHECGEMLCPDTAYIFKHGIDFVQMYTDPIHRKNSHRPSGVYNA